MIGFYNPSVILTYISLISASFGFSVLLGNGENCVFAALIALMISGVCDMFDGAVAQKVKRTEEEKMFGIEIDSLCDLVAFGALPAMIALKLGGGNFISKLAAALILLSSVIRLGFFNVQEIMRDRTKKREGYLGMPVTLVAATYPLLLIFGLLFPSAMSWYAPAALILLAVLEVSRFTLKKVYGKGLLVLLAIGVAELILVCIFGTRL